AWSDDALHRSRGRARGARPDSGRAALWQRRARVAALPALSRLRQGVGLEAAESGGRGADGLGLTGRHAGRAQACGKVRAIIDQISGVIISTLDVRTAA